MSRGKAPSQRQLRVGEEIRHALSEVLMREEFRDPVLQNVTLTISEVRISPDLKNATAFFSPLGGGDEKEIAKALRRAAAFLRSGVGKKMALKYTPQLSFQYDQSFGEAEHISALLNSPKVRRDLDHDADEDDQDA